MDLAAIAAATDGFSGADLGALLSDSQLAAVHEVLAQPQDSPQVSCMPMLLLSQPARILLAPKWGV